MTNLKLKVTLLNQSYIDVKKMPSLWPHSGHVSSSCEAYIVSTRPHFVLCFLFKIEFFKFVLKWIQVCIYMRRRQWQPTPVLFPAKPHGWRSLVGCNPWGP